METTSKLPMGKAVIGTKEVLKSLNEGKTKKVIVSSNCPEFLLNKLKGHKVEKFEGDSKELGTKLGKPFPVSVAAF